MTNPVEACALCSKACITPGIHTSSDHSLLGAPGRHIDGSRLTSKGFTPLSGIFSSYNGPQPELQVPPLIGSFNPPACVSDASAPALLLPLEGYGALYLRNFYQEEPPTVHSTHEDDRSKDPRAPLLDHFSAAITEGQLQMHNAESYGNHFVFCLDVSGSMGELRQAEWTTHSCSRIAAALSAMAAYIDSAVLPNDKFSVYAFDHSVRCVVDWRLKSQDYCPFCFMEDIKRLIATMARSGTSLYSAVVRCCEALQVAVPDGREGTFILITDGEAMEHPDKFEQARLAVSQPEISMRMLLLHIDPAGFHPEIVHPPRALGCGADGYPVQHFVYVEVPLPGIIDGSTENGKSTLDYLGAALSLVKSIPSSAPRSTPSSSSAPSDIMSKHRAW